MSVDDMLGTSLGGSSTSIDVDSPNGSSIDQGAGLNAKHFININILQFKYNLAI